MVKWNREEALRARKIALKKLQNKDFLVARRIALHAQRLYPGLENLSQLLIVCEVYCAAEAKINRDLDWYGILQVDVTADDTVITKNYDRLSYWLHPDRNTLPGVEAAFKLVSEAHAILCDRVRRSLYDIKRQHASREVVGNVKWQSGKAHANKCNVAGCITLSDFTMVFLTICPHCQKRFMYNQRNFLVTCDGCGKNFFAFKMHEQAVPSRFLSAGPNSSQIPPEVISFQQQGVPNQQVQYGKDHATGGNMDSELLVHATRSDDIKWNGSSCDNREGRVETGSTVIQFLAVKNIHSPSPLGEKGATESIVLHSSDPNFVANQNLDRKDVSAVSCHLEGLNKRKQDDCIRNTHDRDSCNYKRQRMDNSLSDATSRNDIMFNDNSPGAENQSDEYLPDKMDSQKEENITIVGYQGKYKEETTRFSHHMHGNPVINYKIPDFFDFQKLRDFKRIAVGQIWAVYDDPDLMPRVYAKINHIDASNLKVQWLEHSTMNEVKFRRTYERLSIACGNFCLGETHVLQAPSMYLLSHRVSWEKGKNRTSFEIHPKKGQVWALYKESNMPWNSGTDKHQSCNYDIVEVSSSLMNIGVIVYPLVRIEGFVSLFAKAKGKYQILIPSGELFRFSHCIPCYRTNGKEKTGVSEGLLELDPAALPCDYAKAFSPISLYSLDKKRDGELVGVTYPDSEFHNFDEERSREKFRRGQVWALYSDTNTLPNIYGWLSKVETEPFKVHLTWLKACPQEDVEKLWLEQDAPMSCGKFEIGNSTSECHENCAFSHLVNTDQIGTDCQVKILPKAGEVWAIYKNWSPDWTPSRNNRQAEYAIGEIIKCTDASTLFVFLTKVDGHVSVFKPEALKGALEILPQENLRFSHSIPSFLLTDENGGKLRGFYELDPAAVPNILL